MVKEKEDWLDIFRGIGAILVIVGHLIYSASNLKIYIFSFHMPLFFFAAGYLFKYENNIKNFIIKKIKKLLVPYFVFAFISFLTTFFLQKIIFDLKTTLKYYFFVNGYIYYNTTLWFLIIMFFVTIIFQIYLHLEQKYNFNKKTSIWIFMICVLIVCVIFYYKKIKLLFGIEIVPHALLIAGIGYIYKSNKKILKQNLETKLKLKNHKIKYLLISLLFIGSYYLALKNGRINMSTCQFQNYFLYLLVAFLGIFIYSIIAKEKIMANNNVLKRFNELSLFMLCTQRILFQFYWYIQEKTNIIFMNQQNLLINGLVIILTLLLYYFLGYKIKKKISFLN